MTFRQAVTRSLVGLAIEWPGLIGAPLTWLVTIWTMIGNPQSKRLGDHVAGTIVIHERTPAAWGWVPTMPPELAAWAATLDLTGLDDDLALGTRNFPCPQPQHSRARPDRARPAPGAGGRHCDQIPAAARHTGVEYLRGRSAERHRRACVSQPRSGPGGDSLAGPGRRNRVIAADDAGVGGPPRARSSRRPVCDRRPASWSLLWMGDRGVGKPNDRRVAPRRRQVLCLVPTTRSVVAATLRLWT